MTTPLTPAERRNKERQKRLDCQGLNSNKEVAMSKIFRYRKMDCRWIPPLIWEDARFQELWHSRWLEKVTSPVKAKRETLNQRQRQMKTERYRFKANYTSLKNEVVQRLGGACLYCGATEYLCLDHVLPMCYGGVSKAWNLQPLCHKCNCRKSTLPPMPPVELHLPSSAVGIIWHRFMRRR